MEKQNITISSDQRNRYVFWTLIRSLISTPVLVLVMLMTVCFSLFLGAYPLSTQQVVTALAVNLGFEAADNISETVVYLVGHIRLPRILLGVLVGAGLSVSGVVVQGLFRNPLADPSLIGITSGAMAFAVAGILFAGTISSFISPFLGYLTTALMAFIGGLISTIVVFTLATHKGRTSVATMLLAGIAITALGGALTGLMTYFSSEEELRDITFWTLGSLGGANWKMLAIVAPVVIIITIILIRHAQQLDLLLLGEKEAMYMGGNVQRIKWMVIICAAFAVGVCVAVSGVITFIGIGCSSSD